MPTSPLSSGAPAPALRLYPLLLAALLGTMAMMAFVAVVGPAVRRLGLPEWVAGLSVTAGGICWMLLARWWGRTSDRVGRKPVLLAGLGVFSLTYLAMALGVDLALRGAIGGVAAVLTLVVARSLVGAFYAAVPPTAAAVIADHTVPAARGSVMAKLGSANAVGMVAGPAAAGWLASRDLGLALYVAAALPALAFVLVALRLPAHPPVAAPAGGPGGKAGLGLGDARLRLPLLTAFIAMASVAVAQVSVGFFAIDRFGLRAEEGARVAGLALTAVGCALIVSQQLVMRLKRVPPLRWVWMGALISGLSFLSVFWVHSQALLFTAYGVAAFGMGFIFPTFQAMAANAVQAHEQGAAAGNLSAAQGLGMVLGPLIGTLVYRLAPGAPYALVGLALLALAASVALRSR
ncbi:MFS transporter [Xenophilus arseniciresistens]|uniref:MFS transporter n=1 Tax=Xenophilus arseniciresistens TaxID=1283306 RepID=A0AAE3N8S1_9BURK|nr:MFS transporter [Xenophilus arseniciresistens]MDA7416649.1 MFS transporter [Xenophilus arseniciresistens]